MAEGGQLASLSSFKDQIDDQLLTCSVCLDQYTNPKTLPCHHSFCLKCIEPLPVEIKDDGECYISCPTCRANHTLPQGGANNLPNAFQINSLLHLRRKLASTAALNATPNQSTNCPKHNDPLKVYCETCNQVICRDCTISSEHNKHTFYLISECYPKHHQQIQDNIDLVKHKLDDMNTAMTRLDTRERQVLEQGENIKEQINIHVQQLIDNIQQSRTYLTQQVDTIVQQKTQTLAKQKQQAQKIRTQLKTCQDMIEHSLKEWNQQQILLQKLTMIDEMKTATQHVDPAAFHPIEAAEILYEKTEKTIGYIAAKTYSRVTLEASPCMAKQPSTAILTLHSHDGSPFSLPSSLISPTLSSPHGNEQCSITKTHIGKYNITFIPSSRNDQLLIQLGGIDVPDSPFTLPVIPTLEMRGEPVNYFYDRILNVPIGVTVLNDEKCIAVAEYGSNCITILSKTGEKVKTIMEEEVIDPCGVAVSIDGHILVTDKYRLLKITTDGVCVKSVGGQASGRGQLQFDHPCGIAVNRNTGHIYVADSNNKRIQVFSHDLTFSHTITPSRQAQMKNPYDIAIDNDGYLYVTDQGNHCITKLTNKGKFVKRIGNEGSGPGQLSNPTCLTIHNNLVYVCECDNDRVSVFDTDGKFHHHIGNQIVHRPYGIAMDTVGNLYVCDISDYRIVVF